MTIKSKEYAVGYKKPPAGKRFKPGQSGNPRGRPKKAEPRLVACPNCRHIFEPAGFGTRDRRKK